MKLNLPPYLAVFSVVILGCSSVTDVPDIGQIELNTSWVRYEKLLADIDTNRIESEIDRISTEHPDFTDVFFYQVIADPGQRNNIYQVANNFLRDEYILNLMHISDSVFSNFEPYKASLEEALKYFHYYFPPFPIPTIYTCMSGFEVGAFTIGDELLGIGLEFYLGNAFQHYDPNLFPTYIQRTMTSEHLVAKTMQALIANYLGEARGTKLQDFMIRNGIELYIKKKVLPYTADSIVLEFTAAQLDWLIKNEGQIYAHLLREELLQSTNYRQFQKLVTPSPSVPNMPPEAPGRVANWIGYQIVDAYLTRHPEKSLLDLLSFEDAQKILAEARYKPRQSI